MRMNLDGIFKYKFKYFPLPKYLSKYIQFWTNVLKYIPSTFKMYLKIPSK